MEFFVELDHKKAGKLKYSKGPCTFEKTDWEWQTAAPILGQDNEQVYCERLDILKKELAGMKKSGYIFICNRWKDTDYWISGQLSRAAGGAALGGYGHGSHQD